MSSQDIQQQTQQEEVYEGGDELSLKDIAYFLGGAALPAIPLELLGTGWVGGAIAVATGIGAAVYREELSSLLRRLKKTSPRGIGFDPSLLNMPVGQMHAEMARRRALMGEYLPKDNTSVIDEPQQQEDESQAVCYQYLDLGEVFQPHVNQVLSNRIAILGMPNAGKTNTVSVLCEELGKRGVPLVLFDTKPEYAKLCVRPYFTNPFRATAKNVNPENAFEFGGRVMRERLQVVVDLTSYGDSDVAARVMIGIVNGIWAWEYALPNDKRVPVTIVLDEAHQWLPQQQNLTDVSKAKDSETGVSLFTQLQKAFFKVINLGRSYGIGIIVSTQRPQNIDKRAINPHEWKFLLKANAPNDLKVYEEYGLEGEIAQKLNMGQAYVIGPGEFCDGAIYQIRRRESPDDSKTPGYENLQAPAVSRVVTPDKVDTVIQSMPVVDWEDDREDGQTLWSTANYRLTGVVKAPAYEQTAQYYYPTHPFNSSLNDDAQNYSDLNPEAPLNESFITGLNDSTSRVTPPQQNANLHLAPSVNGESVERSESHGNPLNVNVNTAKVDASKREMIRRLAEMGKLTHAEIAKAAKLDGPKYAIYKQVCAEEGIEIK